MFKLHIQLEPYNGKKFDFIECECQWISEIPQKYEDLEKMAKEVFGIQNSKTTSSTPVATLDPNAFHIYKGNGKVALSKDKKKKWTNAEVKKILDNNLKPWELNHEDYLKLV